jgi:uncharacterized membrane protein
MPDVHEAVVIAAPVQAVFDYYAEYARHPEWQPELVRAEVLTPGEVRPGTRGAETRRLLGRELSAGYEITEHERPRRSAFRTLEGPIRPRGVATFAPHDGGTRMTFELDLGARGVLRILVPLLARVLTRQTRAHLQRFKTIAERSST